MFEVYLRFGTEAVYGLEKTTVALISTARRTWPLDPAQVIKIMQLLQRRHPEIRVRIKLLIKPGGSAFVDSDAQKIGPCTVRFGAVPILVSDFAGATIEWPDPSHA